MKHLGLILLFIFAGLSLWAQQLADNALGVRLEGSGGIVSEISYQRAFSEKTRLEMDLGFSENNNVALIKFTILFQWVYPLGGSGFNWYWGLGSGFGLVDYEDSPFIEDEEGFSLTADGMIGLEYSLLNISGVPLLFSFDLNPEIEVINDFFEDEFGLGVALALRYQF